MTSYNNMLIQIFEDLFKYIGLSHKFMSEVPASSLNASEEVNIIVGLSGDMEGNILFGCTDKTAKEIAAKLIGVKEVTKFNKYAKSALTDFYSEFSKRFVNKIKAESAFNIATGGQNYTLFASVPTCVLGEDMLEIVSKVQSKKLFFRVNGEKFALAYNLEKK